MIKLAEKQEEEAQVKASQMPKPATYHILCALIKSEAKYDSGLIKSDKTKQFEEMLTPAMFVVDIGPDAFKDEKRFPSGPVCKKGDYVIVRPHSGTRIKIHDYEFRLVNDDSIEAVVEDPRGLRTL